MAKLTSRHTVTDHFVEEGTQGLHYCRLEARSDEPPAAGSDPDPAARLEELHARTRELARRVIEPVTVRAPHPVERRVEQGRKRSSFDEQHLVEAGVRRAC